MNWTFLLEIIFFSFLKKKLPKLLFFLFIYFLSLIPSFFFLSSHKKPFSLILNKHSQQRKSKSEFLVLQDVYKMFLLFFSTIVVVKFSKCETARPGGRCFSGGFDYVSVCLCRPNNCQIISGHLTWEPSTHIVPFISSYCPPATII